jgi:hypothetical protein
MFVFEEWSKEGVGVASRRKVARPAYHTRYCTLDVLENCNSGLTPMLPC